LEWFKRTMGEGIEAKCHLITYGYDPQDYDGPWEQGERFTMTFAGKVYAGTYPAALHAAVRRLVETGIVGEDDIRLRYVGTFDVESHSRLRNEGLGAVVELLGYVEHAQCLRMMRSSHLLLLHLAEGEMSRRFYTAKMFEYFGARRPILALVGEGATKELIEELGVGIVVDPRDVEGIGRAIMEYVSRFRAGDELWVENPRLDEFSRERQAGELAKILDHVARH